MTQFIKLTESMTGGDSRSLIINVANILHCQQGMNGKDTHIRLTDFKSYYFVKESVEQVERMLIDTIDAN